MRMASKNKQNNKFCNKEFQNILDAYSCAGSVGLLLMNPNFTKIQENVKTVSIPLLIKNIRTMFYLNVLS